MVAAMLIFRFCGHLAAVVDENISQVFESGFLGRKVVRYQMMDD
jgi:hypothetical protein